MIVRGVDSNNDWLFGKGKSDYKYNLNALAQNIKTRLQSFLGDCFFAQSEGIDWWNLLGSKKLLDLRLAISSVLLNTDGVTGLIEVSVSLNRDRCVKITYAVSTVYGEMKRSIDMGVG